jgi:hypothetical protein
VTDHALLVIDMIVVMIRIGLILEGRRRLLSLRFPRLSATGSGERTAVKGTRALHKRFFHGRMTMSGVDKAQLDQEVMPHQSVQSQGNVRGNTMTERTALAGKNKLSSATLLSDQRGAVAFEMPFVWLFMTMSLLLPLADLAIAGFRFISAQEALRNMGQRTQYSKLDATDLVSITDWKSSLPTTVDGYAVSAKVYCGDPGTEAPCAGTTWPKYSIFSTSFTLSPMVLGSVLCSTCSVNYSQRFQ